MAEQNDYTTPPRRTRGLKQKHLDDANASEKEAKLQREVQRQREVREQEARRQEKARQKKALEQAAQQQARRNFLKIRAAQYQQEAQLQAEEYRKQQDALNKLEEDRKKIIQDNYRNQKEKPPIQEPKPQENKIKENLQKLDDERKKILEKHAHKKTETSLLREQLQKIRKEYRETQTPKESQKKLTTLALPQMVAHKVKPPRLPLAIFPLERSDALTAASHKRNVDNNQTGWLSEKEIEAVKDYFSQNPTCKKISRKQPINYQGERILLTHSVMKSDDGALYALSRSTNKYKGITGLLGKGSFGAVKLAQSLEDNTIIAAKIQRNNPILEALTPYPQSEIIQLEEDIQQAVGQYVGKAERTIGTAKKIHTKHYTFSDFIEGQSLHKYLDKNPNISPHTKLTIILKVLQATQALHEKGIIHGDLSFNNILYNQKTGEINIIDFGLAVRSDNPNDVVSLPQRALNIRMISQYFAPEGSVGQFSAKTDVHSLGYWIQRYAEDNPSLMKLAQNMSKRNLQQRPDITTCINTIETLITQQPIIHTRQGKP